jgi:hypothetical protein
MPHLQLPLPCVLLFIIVVGVNQTYNSGQPQQPQPRPESLNRQQIHKNKLLKLDSLSSLQEASSLANSPANYQSSELTSAPVIRRGAPGPGRSPMSVMLIPRGMDAFPLFKLKMSECQQANSFLNVLQEHSKKMYCFSIGVGSGATR